MIRFPGVAAFSRRPFRLPAGPGTLWAGDTGFVLARDHSLNKSHWPGWVWGGKWRNAGYVGDPQVPDDNAFDLIDVSSPQHGYVNRAGRTFRYFCTDDNATSDEFTYTIRDAQGQEATGTVYVSIVPTQEEAVITYGSDANDIFKYPHGNLNLARIALPGSGTIRISYGDYNDSISIDEHSSFDITLEGVRGPNNERPSIYGGNTPITLKHLRKCVLKGLEVRDCGQWVSYSVPNENPGFTFRVEDCRMRNAIGNGIHGNHYDAVSELIDSEFSHAGQGNTKHIFYSLGKWLYVKNCVFHSAHHSEMLKNRYRSFLVEDSVFEVTREPDPEWTNYIATDITNHHSARGMYRRCEFILYPRNDGTRGNSGISQRNAYAGPVHNTINPDYYPMHGHGQTWAHPADPAYSAYEVAETDPRYAWPDGDPGSSAYWQDEFWSTLRATGFNPEDQNPFLYQIYHEDCTWRVREDVLPDQHHWAVAVFATSQHPAWRPAQFRGDLSFPVDRPMGWAPRIKMYFANCNFINFKTPRIDLFTDAGADNQYGFHTLQDCIGPHIDGQGNSWELVGHEPKFNTNEPDPFQPCNPFARPGDALPSGWADIIGPVFDFSAGGNNDDRDPADPDRFFGNNNPTVTLPAWWGFNHNNDGDHHTLFPRIVSAEVVDSDTIRLTWEEEDLDVAGPNTASDYTYVIGISAPQTVTTVTTDSATQVTLTGLQTAIQSGDPVAVSFSGESKQNALRGVNLNRAKPFSDWDVSNTL